MNVVVDASVAVKWFVHEELHTEALSLLDQQEALCAPDLLVPEVTNIAWKKVVRGEIESSQGHQIAMDIRTTVPALYPSTFLNARAYNIAVTLNHPVYDCLYLACAELVDSVLITADQRFFKAVQGSDFEDFVRHLAEPDLFREPEEKVIPPLIISVRKLNHVIRVADTLLQAGSHGHPHFGAGVPDLESLLRQHLMAYVENLSVDEKLDIVTLLLVGGGHEETWEALRAWETSRRGFEQEDFSIQLGDLPIETFLVPWVLEDGLAVLRKRSTEGSPP